MKELAHVSSTDLLAVESLPKKDSLADLVLNVDQVIQDPAYKETESYELRDGKTGRRLVFEGVYHAGNPLRREEDTRMMKRLQARLEEFVTICREVGSEPLVFVEGGIPKQRPTEESEARKNEMQFVAFLARNMEVCVESPEPSDLEQGEHLFQLGYTPEQIICTFVLRQLKYRASKQGEGELVEPVIDVFREQMSLLDRFTPDWNLSKGKIPKESYRESIRAWFAYMKTLSGDEYLREENAFKSYTREVSTAFVHTVAECIKKMDGVSLMTFLEGDFVGFDVKKLSDYSHLDEENVRCRPTNKAFADIQRVRDLKVLTKIIEAKKNGKDLFIVFGSYHATAQKPALKRLYA
ncbi:hypothetical protein KBB27_00860 [Patescibacteria group bacterium]|nr:hypothetical protein [Patescibacteria group bacterium]